MRSALLSTLWTKGYTRARPPTSSAKVIDGFDAVRAKLDEVANQQRSK